MSRIKPSTIVKKGNHRVTPSYSGKANLEFKLKTYDAMSEKLLRGKGIDYKYANGNCNNRGIWEGKGIEIEREDGDDRVDVSFSLMDVDVVSYIYIVCVNVVLEFSVLV